jgi:hypothetical protein
MAIDPATGLEVVVKTQETTWVPAGTDAEIVGHIQNKGWDKKTVAEAAIDAAKSHRSAELMLGGGVDNLVRLPKDQNDEAGWKAVYSKLGAPADAKAYDPIFKEVTFTDKTEIDQPFVDVLRKTAVKNHWTVEELRDVTKAVVSYVESGDAGDAATKQAAVALEQKKLVENWGAANVDVNMIIARNAVAKLGIKPEAVAALQDQVGYAAVMEMFHKIGSSIGEDSLIRSLNGGGSPTLSKEQATARIAELKKDTDWTKRYLEGSSKEVSELTALIAIQAG